MATVLLPELLEVLALSDLELKVSILYLNA